MRIGVLGGTFDPVHLGHLSMAEEARIQLGLERVLFLPAGRPWLKEEQPLTAVQHRVNMVRLAVDNNPHFEVCLEEIDRPGPTYTVDTLEQLTKGLDSTGSLYFILGLDAMEQFHRWKEPGRVVELCHLVVVARPLHQRFEWPAFFTQYPRAAGRVTVLSTPLNPISGTEIRRRAADGISLRYQVPEAVAEYIEEHELFKSADADGVWATGSGQDNGSRLLQVALERGALKYGEFTLVSGKKSSYYFDGRLLSLDPEGAHLIARAMLPILREAGAEAVGGLTLGADPMVAGIALASHLGGGPIPGFIVRKEAKAHGTRQGIEGPLEPGCSVAIIDDVCTSGGSLFQAIAAVEAAGCTVVKVLAILDRREGGSEEIRRLGYDFVALLQVTPEGKIEVCRTP
jgi:nicotinate (nicotinamide) nucleotide adenylyltransferase